MTGRQREIIKLAIKVIVEEGLAHLTMKKVAERAGFSEPALYRYFKSKQSLILAIIEEIKAKLTGIAGKTDVSLPPDVFFQSFLCSIMNYLQSVEGVTILIMTESSYQNDAEIRTSMYSFYREMVEFLSDYIETQIRYGHFQEELNAEAAASVFFGIIQSMVLRYHLSGKAVSIDSDCHSIISIYLKGVLK
jgi:AcrR family transcriptional regulator